MTTRPETQQTTVADVSTSAPRVTSIIASQPAAPTTSQSAGPAAHDTTSTPHTENDP